MNREQRRAFPQDENKRVTLFIEGGDIILSMIGQTSKVASHAILSPEAAIKLAEALVGSVKKVMKPEEKSRFQKFVSKFIKEKQ